MYDRRPCVRRLLVLLLVLLLLLVLPSTLESSSENKILQLVLFRLLQAVRDDAAKLVHNTPRTKLFDDKVRQTLVTLRAVQRQAWCSTRRG